MLKLSNIVSEDLKLSLNNITFEKGKVYGIESDDSSFNLFLCDLIRGLYIPDKGSVYVTLGENTDNLLTVSDRYMYSYARKYVYLENGISLVNDLSVKDNMMLLARGHRGVKFVKLQKLLKMVHIDNYDKKVKDLTANEKFRVKLAQILFMQPKLILCNDIFKDIEDSGESKEEIESLLCDVSSYIGATLVYIGMIYDRGNFNSVLDVKNIVKERF